MIAQVALMDQEKKLGTLFQGGNGRMKARTLTDGANWHEY
jgi:hypothetical protein